MILYRSNVIMCDRHVLVVTATVTVVIGTVVT